MRSNDLGQFLDDKSVASCQQTCCKLIVKTCSPLACCKLFQQVVTSLHMTNCNKQLILTDLLQLDEIDKFVATCWQVQEAGKIGKLQQA